MTSSISASPETYLVSSPQQINSLSCPRPRYKVSDVGNSPPRPTLASDATSPLVRSRPPMMSPMFLRRPAIQARMDRGQIMVPLPITAWERAVDHYASHTDTIHTIQACASSLLATIPSIREKSCYDSCHWGLGSLRRSNCKDRHVATVVIMILHFIAIRLRLSEHIAIASNDRGHSSNSNTPPTIGPETSDLFS
jgi:hypothetical protein